MPELLGITAMARLLGRSEKTVRAMADSGRLPCTRDSANRRQFAPESVDRGLAELAARQARRPGGK